MYKYLLFLIIGIILFVLLNTKDGFSISGRNIGDICIDSDDCKYGDNTECGYPNPPICSCEENVCENRGATADEGVPGGDVELPPPVIPPFRPPVPPPRVPPPVRPVRPTRQPPIPPQRPVRPNRPPPQRPAAPPIAEGFDSWDVCAAVSGGGMGGGGMGGGGMGGGGMAGGGMAGGAPPPIRTVEVQLHNDVSNPFEIRSIGEWCDPVLLNCVAGASCTGTKLENGILYYICE